MANGNNATIGFEKQIWDAACVLWGHIPAAEYRKVIVGLIFLRYISNAFEKRFVSKIVPFSCKTYRFCHCEEGIFNARRGNLKRDETASRNELRGREGKRSLAASR